MTMELDLPAQARVVGVSYTYGSPALFREPLREFGEKTAKSAAAFNRNQPRVVVPREPEGLVSWLTDHLEERFDDAYALWDALGRRGPEPTRHEVYLLTSSASDPMFGSPLAVYGLRPGDMTSVHYRVMDEAIASWGFDQLVEVFGLGERPHRSGSAALDHALAGLAGYAEDDLSIRTPLDGPPWDEGA